MGLAGAVAMAAGGAGAEEAPPMKLTLGTPAFREVLERTNPAFEAWPDVRVKLATPREGVLSVLDEEPRVRGVEFRLPASVFWMGVEWPGGSEDSRATFSIQAGF